ncbi:unnamed protein product [Ambrosiozyma monospora]|uniref:Unnamed protein product n=1 Tax=Ambrosiozyma monospora TaxID=43982 RepID=A0A9W6YQB1_AMBMO|nr:unnamed protein product [Ambrosiozyma monospora]
MNAQLLNSYDCGEWVISLVSLPKHGIVAATSDGHLLLLPHDPSQGIIRKFKAHDQTINKIRAIDDNRLASCSNDCTVKLWDFSNPGTTPLATLTNSHGVPFLSLDSKHGLLAAGTELSGVDAELVIWDLNNLKKPLRSFIDSHNDDIMDIKFHPTRKNLLLSGSTDGYVNLYDLNVKDEEDALLQVINFESIHSVNLLADSRIYTLSHMETLAIHEMSNLAVEEAVEPKPKEFGDVRESWGCEYVVDLIGPGYVACGSNSKGELKLFKFDPATEQFDVDDKQVILFPRGHGEEVVRDLVIYNDMIYTGGEDKTVKVWKAPSKLVNTTVDFFVGEKEPADEEMVTMEQLVNEEAEKEKKHKHKHKHKHHHKDKKDKKDKSDNKGGKSKKEKKHSHRFKPY